MEHTYLRYECADSFGVTIASASSKAPNSSGILEFTSDDTLLTVAGSYAAGFRLKSALQPVEKLGHTQQVAGNMGTGKALNGEEMVCITSSNSSTQVATGWVDGTVRIFDRSSSTPTTTQANTLLDDSASMIWQSDPLLLNGHSGSPVRVVRFDHNGSRLGSGGSDGTVVLWDVVAETGLYRLLGHRGGVTAIAFYKAAVDALISCSLDCLIKIWDLDHQCCIQTIVSPSEVLTGVCVPVNRTNEENFDRWRFIAGGSDGHVRVWSVEQTSSNSATVVDAPTIALIGLDDEAETAQTTDSSTAISAQFKRVNMDDLCRSMGMLTLPPNVVPSNDKASCVHFDESGKYIGVLRGKHIDVFSVRSIAETHKKRARRLKRRQEKSNKKTDGDEASTTKSKKRGILDDDDDVDILDDNDIGGLDDVTDPELIKVSDEFEYLATVRASQKMRGFRFCTKERGELCRVVGALTTNALETHSILRKSQGNKNEKVVLAEKINTFDFYGHPTGIRSIAISSDDRLTCTVSKNVTKVWNIASRSCIQSLPLSIRTTVKNAESCYGLCTAFLPGNTHVVVGTREGHLLLIDISAGDVVYVEQGAHDGAIWALDVIRPSTAESSVSVVTGSADKSVKFWSVESQDDDGDGGQQPEQPMLVQTRTLQMADDVIAVKCSHAQDSTKRLVFVSTLDCTVKVFFEDSLKMFLSLYGHKLPALAVDCSDDDVLLVSGGADKTIKIWGLDFGDTHRTLHGHGDSITDLRFVRRSHYFFSSSKDGTVRYWDADRFEQILLLNGHCAEVNCLAVSRAGAFVLSGGMDRQVRVWERTRDIVFLEEERERELEHVFDRLNNRDEGDTSKLLDRKRNAKDDNEDDDAARDHEPQSETAVRKSVLSVSSGDRIMEALERADQEFKDTAAFRATNKAEAVRGPNAMMLGLEPAHYILWVLRTVKSAEVEQSLIVLSIRHIERLMYYLIVLLKLGLGIELCSRVAIALIKAHQNQIVATKSMVSPLRELRRLIRVRVAETRDVAGFDLAALKLISKVANERQQAFLNDDSQVKDIWAGLGLGSDVAAALEGRPKRR